MAVRSGAFLVPIILYIMISGAASALAVDEDVIRFRQERARMRVDAYLEEGKKELERGSYVRAIRLFSSAMGRSQGGEVLRLRGKAYYLSGMYPEAIADISRAIQDSPRDPSGYDLLGDVFLAKGDYSAALKNYENAINADPLYAQAYVGRAIAYLSVEKYSLAIQDFQVALQNWPSDDKLIRNLSLACFAADLPRAGQQYAGKIANADMRTELIRHIENKTRNQQKVSLFEEGAGNLGDYSAKTASVYEGSATSTILTSAVRPEPDVSYQKISTRRGGAAAPTQISVQGALRGRIGSGQTPGKGEFSGTWDGTYMGLKWTIDFKAQGHTVNAILKIFSPSGKEDVHYCEGVIQQDGSLDASDNQGFRFVGRLTEDYRVVGTVSRKDGKSIDIDMPVD